MNKTLSKIIASAMIATTLMTAAIPVTSGAADTNAAVTIGEESTTKASTNKTMYAIKSVYSYKNVNGKLKRDAAVFKGAALKIKSQNKKYYILDDGRYIKKSAVGAKRINWTDTEYKKPITRYISKDNTKARTEALTSGKVITKLAKGTEVTIVAKTNTGFYKLSDGSYIKQSSTTKTKPSTKPTIKSELHPEIENINLPKMNDLLNYNVKPISETSAKEIGLTDDFGDVMYPNFENLTDSYLLTDSELCSHENLDAYMNEKLIVGTDIPAGLYYVTYNSFTGGQSTYFKHTNKNGKEQDKIYLYAPNYREIYGFDEWNFYIYASKGDVIKGSGLALIPAPNFNFTENFYGCRYRNYYVSEKNGDIKPGTYTIKVDKEGIDETLSYVSFWRGRGMYGVYTMDKNGDFVSVTTDTYMQGGYEMDGALVDGTITITLEEGQLIEMRDLILVS